jgi:hypothetical protein
MDFACDLASEMIFTRQPHLIVKHTYSDTVVEPMDLNYIKGLLNAMTVDNMKVIISGKELTHGRTFNEDGEAEEFTEHWFKTKYIKLVLD